MLLTSVNDVVFTMVPDVTTMALSYCECGRSMAESIPGILGRMSSVPLLHAGCRLFWARVSSVPLLHADDSTRERCLRSEQDPSV